MALGVAGALLLAAMVSAGPPQAPHLEKPKRAKASAATGAPSTYCCCGAPAQGALGLPPRKIGKSTKADLAKLLAKLQQWGAV